MKTLKVFGYGSLGAVVAGLIGLCVGYFGPIIFHPESNQGPLFGIFISGPLSAILGFIGGVAWGIRSER